MTSCSRSTIVEILNFAKELNTLCDKYTVKCLFSSGGKLFELKELPHLPKSMLRKGVFRVEFLKDRPSHRPFRTFEWGIWTDQVKDITNLEETFLSEMLKWQFEQSPTQFW